MLGRDSGVVVAAGIKCGMSADDVRAALLKTPQALAPLAALDAEEAATAQRAAEEAAAAQRAAVSATGDETPNAPEKA